jgi:hypothetical protein
MRTVVLAVVLLGGARLPLREGDLAVETFVATQWLGVTPGEERHRWAASRSTSPTCGWRDLARPSPASRGAAAGRPLRACAFAENYGQAGALEHFAREMDLPPAISGHNSYYLWGPGHCTGDILLVLGSTRDRLLERFETVEPGAVFRCRDCMPYEDEKPIWIARGLRAPLAAAWSSVKHYN